MGIFIVYLNPYNIHIAKAPVGIIFLGGRFLYNTPSKHHPIVRIVKGDVFMEQQKIIDELNYYKAQALTELLYASGMITVENQ